MNLLNTSKCALKLMKKSKCLCSIVISLVLIQSSVAQGVVAEVGVGIGNVAGKKHNLGKAEVHLSVFKSFQFGQLGLDFATGGNFIPGTRSTVTANSETLSPNDSQFGSISILYRLPIKKYLFIEPRLGYTSLFAYVHTDDKTSISQPNFSAGVAFGGTIKEITLSLRYQYYGSTASYEGFKDSVMVKSNSEPLSLVLFRVSYRFGLGDLFGK